MGGAPWAAIDIGTNTVRLLLARPARDGALERLDDQTATVRLGQGVDQTGRLAPERMQRAAEAVARFATQARAAGAEVILALATSAVRDAANRADFVALVQEMSRLVPDIIDGEREAALTFRGALAGRSIGGRQLVADVGGGSTEVVVAYDGAIRFARSLQLGSGRLTERCLPGDPPASSEVAAARTLARTILQLVPDDRVDEVVVVGGTATAALALVHDGAERDQLTRDQLAHTLAWLLARPAAQAAQASALDPERVRVMPGGLLIIEALIERFGLDTVSISRGGIREGALLERLVAGA